MNTTENTAEVKPSAKRVLTAEERAAYRSSLIRGAQKSQDDLDKALLTLSGGALAISLVFLKDIVGDQPVVSLFALTTAWLAWGLSVIAVLVSFEFASKANRRAIKFCDEGFYDKLANAPGGVFSYLVRVSNAIAALAFVVGVVSMLIFVTDNLESRRSEYEQHRQGQSSASANPSTAAEADSRGRASAST